MNFCQQKREGIPGPYWKRSRENTSLCEHRDYMAAQSPYPEDLKLYDTLYAFLSEYTHPHLASFPSYSGGNDGIHSHANLINALVYTLFFSALILDEALKSPRA